MILGKFTQDTDGSFHGKLKAYGLETPIALTPQTNKDGKAYYTITGDLLDGGFDGGIAFPRRKGDMSFIAVTMDSPVFAAPISAALFQDKRSPEVFNLVWDRPDPKLTPTAESTLNGGHTVPRRYIGAGATP